MRIQVVQAAARVHETRWLDLLEGATVADAIAACGLERSGFAGVALFGKRVQDTQVLADGDRVELLRPLLADPKDARRRREKRAAR